MIIHESKSIRPTQSADDSIEFDQCTVMCTEWYWKTRQLTCGVGPEWLNPVNGVCHLQLCGHLVPRDHVRVWCWVNEDNRIDGSLAWTTRGYLPSTIWSDGNSHAENDWNQEKEAAWLHSVETNEWYHRLYVAGMRTRLLPGRKRTKRRVA